MREKTGRKSYAKLLEAIGDYSRLACILASILVEGLGASSGKTAQRLLASQRDRLLPNT